jgi:NADH-quinone oxidoreductase subunit A
VIQAYSGIFLFLAVGIVFVAGGLFTSRLIRPNRPNAEKNTTYESGEDPLQNSWGNFNIRFYLVALIFIIFEAEIIFLFPWATVFANKALMEQTNGLWGWMALGEVFLFVLILALGLAYVWKKGYLDWDKPKNNIPKSTSVVPKNLYQEINQKYS